MTFSRSKSLLIILSIITLVLVVVLILGVYTIRAKNEETSTLLNANDSVLEAEVNARAIRQIQQDYADDILAFNALVLSDDRLVAFIEEVESTASNLGLEADILSVDENKENEGAIKTIKLSIEAEGTWSETFSFLKAIENLPHRVMMESVSLKRNELNWESRFTFSLHLFD